MKHYLLIFVCLINQIYAMEQKSDQLDLIKQKTENDLVYKGFEQLLGKINTYKRQPLVGGFSGNAPYRCIVNNTNYVVRTFRDAPEVRKLKVSLNCLVAQKKIAPQIHHHAHHDDFSFIIMEFIDAPTLSVEQANELKVLKRVAQKTRTIAGFDINMETAHKEDMWGETIRHYENIKKREVKVFEPLLEEIKPKLDILKEWFTYYNRPCVINHNDFYHRNIFFGKKDPSVMDWDVLIIDWETLAPSYEFADLACYSVCSCLNSAQDDYLLRQYLQKVPLISDTSYFTLVKLLMRIFIIVGTLDYAKYVPQDLSLDSIKSFKEYVTAFAKDTSNDTPQFLYEFGMSQLPVFRRKYEKFEKEKNEFSPKHGVNYIEK